MAPNAIHISQKASRVIHGNASDLEPIMAGISRFPKPPVSTGIKTKKIITEACIVNSTV